MTRFLSKISEDYMLQIELFYVSECGLEYNMPITYKIVIRIQSNNTINQYSTNTELIQ